MNNQSADTSSAPHAAPVPPSTTTPLTTNASKNLRGLNKPKCIKCGNVARSRSSDRVTSLSQLSSNFAQFNNLRPARSQKPPTQKAEIKYKSEKQRRVPFMACLRLHLQLLFLFIGCVSGLIIERWNCDPDAPQRAAIGIDLGSTYCRVGTWSYKNGVQIIPNDRGNLMTPSWISFTHNQTFIGEDAKNRALDYPESTFSFDVHKFLGRRFEDEEVQVAMNRVPYKIINMDGKPYIQVKIIDGEQKLFSPEELTSLFLKKMKEIAEDFLGKEIELALVTFPGIPWSVYYTDVQHAAWDARRSAMKEAGNMAGLKKIYQEREAEAAAMAYHLDVEASDMNILILNLGGSTFEATINVKWHGFRGHTISADTNLGGEDFDQRVMDYFTTMIKNKYGKDILKDKKALTKLKNECERAKIALSDQNLVQLEIKSLIDGVDFSEPLTRAQFEELNIDLFNKIIELVEKAIEDAGLKKEQIDEIILCGGSTNIPKVKQLVRDFFDGKEANTGLKPDEVVVFGASRRAAYIGSDCNIPQISHYPISSLYPWRISLPVGVRTTGGVFSKVTSGPYVFPLKKSKVFTTTQDFQTRISIQIYEGEGNFTKDCRFLGRLELTGIPPAPRGKPRIEIAFRIDYLRYINVKQSRLHFLRYINVKAELKGTHISGQITVIRNALEDLSEDREAIDYTQQMALPGPPYSAETRFPT